MKLSSWMPPATLHKFMLLLIIMNQMVLLQLTEIEK